MILASRIPVSLPASLTMAPRQPQAMLGHSHEYVAAQDREMGHQVSRIPKFSPVVG